MAQRTEQERLIKIFEDCGAIVHGHFVYASKKHGEVYVDKEIVYPYRAIHILCRKLVLNCRALGMAEAIVAPAKGGIVLSRLVADAVTRLPEYKRFKSRSDVLAIYAEKTADGKNFFIRPSYAKLLADRWVAVVDDIATSGESLKKVVEIARACGAKVIGGAVLWNRSGKTSREFCDGLGIDFFGGLVTKQFDTWDEADCPPCKKGVPVNQELGHGREFLTRKAMEDITKAANMAAAEIFGGKKEEK